MPKVSIYARQRIRAMTADGLKTAEIFKRLRIENLPVSFPSVARISKKVRLTGNIENDARPGRPRKLDGEAEAFIDAQMRANDETTSRQIQRRLERRGVLVSRATVRKYRRERLGWTLERTRYCQMIREVNKEKRFEYAQRVMDTGETFHNVIFSDESSISLEQFRTTCYRKKDEPAKKKPKPKHPLKVHVWAGISRVGATKICIFDGILEAGLYCDILKSTLIPFLWEKLPDHRFMQDNDPKHTSRAAKQFMEDNGINWWRTPPESPDLNPIENLWHEVKFYQETRVKPRTKEQLVDGMKKFWAERMLIDKCNRYIDHVLEKAILKCVEEKGAATGYWPPACTAFLTSRRSTNGSFRSHQINKSHDQHCNTRFASQLRSFRPQIKIEPPQARTSTPQPFETAAQMERFYIYMKLTTKFVIRITPGASALLPWVFNLFRQCFILMANVTK